MRIISLKKKSKSSKHKAAGAEIKTDGITAIQKKTQRLEDNPRDAQIATDAIVQYKEDLIIDHFSHRTRRSLTHYCHLKRLKLQNAMSSKNATAWSKELLTLKSMRY